jgi:hypothetical protein
MSRLTNLEQSIRESDSLIREYEHIPRLSDRPKKKRFTEHLLALLCEPLALFVAGCIPSVPCAGSLDYRTDLHTNVPFCRSRSACSISCRVFITNGP